MFEPLPHGHKQELLLLPHIHEVLQSHSRYTCMLQVLRITAAVLHSIVVGHFASVGDLFRLSAGGQQSIHAIFTPTATGKAEVLIACCTDSLSPPAGFSAVSHVKGVSVAYAVQHYRPATPLPLPSPLASLSALVTTGKAGHQPPVINTDAVLGSHTNDSSATQENRPQQAGSVRADFGDCSIGETKALLLSITNESPIAASVNLWLDTFQMDSPSATVSVAAALSQPYAMASSGSILPRSPTGHNSHVTQLSSAGGMSASWAQSPTPTLPLGSTAGAGGPFMGRKHTARRAGSRTGTERNSRENLVSPS